MTKGFVQLAKFIQVRYLEDKNHIMDEKDLGIEMMWEREEAVEKLLKEVS